MFDNFRLVHNHVTLLIQKNVSKLRFCFALYDMPLSTTKFYEEALQLADSHEGFSSIELVKSRLSSEKDCYLSVPKGKTLWVS